MERNNDKTRRRPGRFRKGAPRSDYENKVVEIKRVTRVVAGGKRMRFRALVVIGDRKGKVGVGLRKGSDVADAIGKASAQARKNLIKVNLTEDGTIPHGVSRKYKGAKVILKPAREGTGIIAGGPVRAILDMVGVRNISSKMLGSANKVSNVRATYEGLKTLAAVDSKDDGKKKAAGQPEVKPAEKVSKSEK